MEKGLHRSAMLLIIAADSDGNACWRIAYVDPSMSLIKAADNDHRGDLTYTHENFNPTTHHLWYHSHCI